MEPAFSKCNTCFIFQPRVDCIHQIHLRLVTVFYQTHAHFFPLWLDVLSENAPELLWSVCTCHPWIFLDFNILTILSITLASLSSHCHLCHVLFLYRHFHPSGTTFPKMHLVWREEKTNFPLFSSLYVNKEILYCCRSAQLPELYVELCLLDGPVT